MMDQHERQGQLGALGVGWRPQLALEIERRQDIGFVEIVAESFPNGHVPQAIMNLRERGLPVIPHGVGLSLCGAQPPSAERLALLAKLARHCESPWITEHLAFVRAGGMESGHLLPPQRTWEALDVVVENIERAQAALPVPLALENPAALFAWPSDQLSLVEYLTEVLRRTGAGLLLDISNLFADACNYGVDALQVLDRLPLERVAYAHLAGGVACDGFYSDTHAHPVPEGALDLLRELLARRPDCPVLLERDENFGDLASWHAELDVVLTAQASAHRLAAESSGVA